jgi:AraC family transcriptional regulator of adaptative response / DNA-3-methyladenine glycosylase II
MLLDNETCFRALTARDVRFDGVFFVGVTTTGIYCRPVCTARTPGFARCRFFPNAALAEREGFRPCLRCRPELAPGHAPVDAVGNLARRAAARIEAGALNDGRDLEQLAQELRISSRQLRRAIRQEFGVSPVELAQTNRLLLAKRLLAETSLPMIDVALASGFASVRRFNALFRDHYGLAPSQVRRSRCAAEAGCIRLTLAYRPPLAWRPLLEFLAARGAAGVECTTGDSYARTVCVGKARGWLRVEPIAGRNALMVELSTSLVPALSAILPRLRSLFDLAARPDVIEGHLMSGAASLLDSPCGAAAVSNWSGLWRPPSPPAPLPGGEGRSDCKAGEERNECNGGEGTSSRAARNNGTRSGDDYKTRLAESIRRAPGLRVPGAFDGFELAVRAILGQRVSVAAATTLAGRVAARFGEPVETPFPCLNRLTPTPERLAGVALSQLTRLGIAAPRAGAIRELARGVVEGTICLDPGANAQDVMNALKGISGIGDWTANYVAMRALRWPDAFPHGDLGLLRGAGMTSAAQLGRAAEAWRPWRAYAAMHLWRANS